MSTAVIIVAAGAGSRFGADLPKQFVPLCGRPVLMHTIDAFRRPMPEARIILVLSPEMEQLWRDMCRQNDFESPDIVYGGETRAHSVANAVLSLDSVPDVIMVHDGARPLVDPDMLARITEALASEADAAGIIPVILVTDTIRRVDALSSEVIARASLRAVQTPQAFRGQKLYDAYSSATADGTLSNYTDDASLMPPAGIRLCEGNPRNIKITHPQDIATAEYLLTH